MTIYSVIVPVIPYQLDYLGYGAISARTSWLLFSFVCIPFDSMRHCSLTNIWQSLGSLLGAHNLWMGAILLNFVVYSDVPYFMVLRALFVKEKPVTIGSCCTGRLSSIVHGGTKLCGDDSSSFPRRNQCRVPLDYWIVTLVCPGHFWSHQNLNGQSNPWF